MNQEIIIAKREIARANAKLKQLNKDLAREKKKSDDLLRTLPSRERGAEEALIRKERALLLERVLLSLPHDLRETFVLLTVEEITSRSAADILGIPESSVRNRLFRARNMVKEKLAALMEVGQ